jgi:hypothetical protein
MGLVTDQASLEARWRETLKLHFRVQSDGDFWCRNLAGRARLPRQGWKIHVSATPFAAAGILHAVVSYVAGQNILCKTLRDPMELARLNVGLHYGYSQIGKFITIYPADEEECVRTAHAVARLTAGMPGPMVPFEHRVSPDSPVYVRYGLFEGSGRGEERLRAPDGAEEIDHRDKNPEWATLPDGLIKPSAVVSPGPLGSRYVAYAAISQRGKGGVYLVLDVAGQLRKCVLKEGRRFGEAGANGEDGYSRIEEERATLERLRSFGIRVPEVYDYFQQGEHRYLVLEHIKGRILAEAMKDGFARAESVTAIRRCMQVASLLADIHAAGYVWRDLKATNLILTTTGEIRPVDFEGSLPYGTRIQSRWGSPGHVPAEWLTSEVACCEHDLFALGKLIEQLHTPRDAEGKPVDCASNSLPAGIQDLVARLTSDDPQLRPSATSVARILSSMLEADLATRCARHP